MSKNTFSIDDSLASSSHPALREIAALTPGNGIWDAKARACLVGMLPANFFRFTFLKRMSMLSIKRQNDKGNRLRGSLRNPS